MTDEGQLTFGDLEPEQPAQVEPMTLPPETAGAETTAEPPAADVGAEPIADEPLEPEATEVPTEPAKSPVTASEAPTAFDSIPPCEARLFFLTNRMNLNGILSSRVLAPRESFSKYYADLLARCPGWVPLLTAPPSRALIEEVLQEKGAGTPVLIEFPLSVLHAAPTDEPVVYVRALPIASATAIHFRERKALREYKARGYSNVHPHDDLLQVTPELFVSDQAVDQPIVAPADSPATDWQRIDRVRGAVNAALAASDSGESLAIAAALLGAGKLTEWVTVPGWLTWDALADPTTLSSTGSDAEAADRLTFQAAYRVLGERDAAEAWSPSEVLDTVVASVIAQRPTAAVGTIIERNLQRVRELVNVEREFEPFRDTGNALVAAKALLLTLLRPDLAQLIEWPAEETGADHLTRVAAAVLAGRLRGLARESVALRSLALDDITGQWAVHIANGADGPIGVVDFVADEAQTSVLVNGCEIRSSYPLIPDPVSLYAALSSEGRERARLALSRLLGWPVVVRVQLPVGADVVEDDGQITITSSEVVQVVSSVDEDDFVARLRATSGQARRAASAALEPETTDG